MSNRAYHRPISVFVETIEDMPAVRELPTDTQMTVNLKFNRASRREMILRLIREELADESPEYSFVTVKGVSP